MSPPKISISTNQEHQIRAARLLSESLDELKYPHAFIGGFAWSLLGSRRPTQDVDILIQPVPGQPPIQSLVDELAERDRHFAKANIKFYFVQEPKPSLDGTGNVMQGINNVLIETLVAGQIGLPTVASPTHSVELLDNVAKIPILHPSILILTKLKRWTVNRASTREKTKTKTATDRADMEYLIVWLAEQEWKIELNKYEGKLRGDLLPMMRQFHQALVNDDNADLLAMLEAVMYPVDWQDMRGIVLPPTVEEDVFVPHVEE